MRSRRRPWSWSRPAVILLRSRAAIGLWRRPTIVLLRRRTAVVIVLRRRRPILRRTIVRLPRCVHRTSCISLSAITFRGRAGTVISGLTHVSGLAYGTVIKVSRARQRRTRHRTRAGSYLMRIAAIRRAVHKGAALAGKLHRGRAGTIEAVIDDRCAARNVRGPVIDDGTVMPPAAPVVPSPAPRSPWAKRNAPCEADTVPEADSDK